MVIKGFGFSSPAGRILREANRMKGAGENGLVSGSWLFIPMVTFYRVGKDETWKSIAARFYGSELRAAALVEANKGNRKIQPDEGAELVQVGAEVAPLVQFIVQP